MRREVETAVPRWPPWHPGNWPTNIIRDVGYAAIRIAACAADAEAVGCSLEALGARARCDPFEAMTDLLIASEGQVTATIDGISGTVDDEGPLERLIADPGRALISDAWDIGRGTPHPGAYGAFGKVLRRYVRERRLLPLHEAVHKMTGLPARLFGLRDRGVLRPGAWADLVVFGPDRVGDRSTEEDPRRFTEGIELVLVNGVPVLRNGRLAHATAGQVLRRERLSA